MNEQKNFVQVQTFSRQAHLRLQSILLNNFNVGASTSRKSMGLHGFFIRMVLRLLGNVCRMALRNNYSTIIQVSAMKKIAASHSQISKAFSRRQILVPTINRNLYVCFRKCNFLSIFYFIPPTALRLIPFRK
jgi:hypothetical protein